MSPLLTTINTLTAASEHRHAWISPFAAKIDRWREEDELNGQPWGETNNWEAGVPNKQPASNSEEAK